jgi:hypothetical protein
MSEDFQLPRIVETVAFGVAQAQGRHETDARASIGAAVTGSRWISERILSVWAREGDLRRRRMAVEALLLARRVSARPSRSVFRRRAHADLQRI